MGGPAHAVGHYSDFRFKSLSDLTRMPTAVVSEFDTRSTTPGRLTSEEPLLYRNLSDNIGLSTSAARTVWQTWAYGMVEKCRLRRNYYGWRFARTEKDVEQPFEYLLSLQQG